jgi:aryl-alcohol dehydrogenase-like predicted oxidoreductase
VLTETAILAAQSGTRPTAGSGRAQGLVQAVGVSNYGPRQLERIHAYLERRGVPLASAQARRQAARAGTVSVT